MDEKKTKQNQTVDEPRKRRDLEKKSRQYQRRDMNRDQRNNRRDRRRNSNDWHKPQKPRNIRYGTTFCGECRACEFWVKAKFGKYRCENSYLPFEILEFRRDGTKNQITEIVLNLLV